MAVKRGKYQQEVGKLNEWRLVQMRLAESNKYTDECPWKFSAVSAEYTFLVADLKQKWSPDHCQGLQIFGFGSDDSGQLSIRDPVKEETDEEEFDRTEEAKLAQDPNYQIREYDYLPYAFAPTILNKYLSRLKIAQMCAGSLYSVVLTVDGRVFTFGNADKGGLGRDCDNEKNNKTPPR